MKRALALMLVLLLIPGPLAAQTLDELLADQPELELVPKPEVTKCQSDQRCMDLEAYKLYLQMRVQYVWLFKVHTKMVPSIVSELKNASEANAQAEAVQAERAERAERAYDDLFPKYVKEVRRAENAKALSIFGGGLPWLIVSAVVGAGFGMWAGFQLAK